ncbi:hypothetical protein [Roseomonas rosulenta]|uniref:hypothetical protein n=1 Tax=Roseomonas rosulenta TaxID=2748667 RepID=UPI0018DF5CC2|nr:hypothetical protein [Roseomonas rosulenta]
MLAWHVICAGPATRDAKDVMEDLGCDVQASSRARCGRHPASEIEESARAFHAAAIAAENLRE